MVLKPRAANADAEGVTLSPPVRIVALVGLVLVVAAGGLLAFKKVEQHRSAAATPPAARTVPVAPAHPKPAPAPAKPITIPGIPPEVTAALRASDTVVALVYSPHAPGDLALLAEARAGAKAAHAAFVPLNVAQDTIAVDVYAWTKAPADPEVLVVKRPGRVAFTITGATDRLAIAQAAATAK